MMCIKESMVLSLMGVILWLTGCAGYHAGTTNGLPAGSRSVRVEFFDNETLEPRLVVAVNRALKHNLQRDGTYTLGTQGEADIVVSGQLTKFLRNGLSYTPGDSLVVQDYVMQLTARIKVSDETTGLVVYEGEVTGKSIAPVGNDLTAGQRQAIPLIADHLARQATSFIVDGHWPDEAKAR